MNIEIRIFRISLFREIEVLEKIREYERYANLLQLFYDNFILII